MFSAVGRFTDWDEAVFFAQSGGYRGAVAPPLPLGPSREGGTAGLIAAIRAFGFGLEGVRLAWMFIVLGLGLFAFVRLGNQFGRWSGEIGFLTFGLFWTTMAFATSLYGSLIWGVLAVVVVVSYLDLIDRLDEWSLREAIVFGLLVSALFWMRSLESVIVIGLLSVHLLAWRRALILRSAWQRILVSLGVYAFVFVIPWIVWSTVRWGSVPNRFAALLDLTSSRPGLELSGAEVYWRSLTGGIPTNGLFVMKPTWVWPVVSVFLIVSVVVIVVSLAVASRDMRMKLFLGVAPFVTLAVFFVMFYDRAFRDRYVSSVVPLFAAVLGAATAIAMARDFRIEYRRALAIGGVLLFVVWSAAQWSIASHYQHARIEHAAVTERTVETIRALSDDRTCVGVSRYGRAQVQLGSGCRVLSATTIEGALEKLSEFEDTDVVRFVLWPNRNLESIPAEAQGWMSVDFSTEWRATILYVDRDA